MRLPLKRGGLISTLYILLHKVLKKIFQIDFSCYMVKEMLLRPFENSNADEYDYLYSTMCQADLRLKFES
jgi:hypothetical protein